MIDTIDTPAGKLPLTEYPLGRWSIQHAGVILTEADETHSLVLKTQHVPYGIFLWPASIALAQEVATRSFAGDRVLELGAGTGLPGIVAASLGGQVAQTDHDPLVLQLCQRNAQRNGTTVDHRLADWTRWDDPVRYDYILGADILYSEKLFGPLRQIFTRNLKPGGRVLLADPFRGIQFLEEFEKMQAEGWTVTRSRRGVEGAPVQGIYELVAPRGKA